MYNTILRAAAARIAAKLPKSPVYIDEIPQKADGSTFVRIVEDAREKYCNRRHFSFSMEVLYFQSEHDTLAYGQWVSDMYEALDRIIVDGFVLFPKNCSARQDTDNRFYQFTMDIDFILFSIPKNDPMETLKTDISEG